MKISVDEDRTIVLEEVFNGVKLKTEEGNAIGVCMRDDTLEINVIPKGSTKHNWWRINMQKGIIESDTHPIQDREVFASEALFGFVGWLITLDNKIITSAKHDATIWTKLIDEYCRANNFQPPRNNYHKLLVVPGREKLNSVGTL